MDFQVNLLLLALVFCSLTKCQAQTCGDIGTNAQEFTESREQNFFLNTQDPAPCDGTIDQFEYCYYLTDQVSARHLFTFAVYRETNPGSNAYTPISDPFNTGTTFFSHGGNSFTCITYPAGQTIQVQAGDMIGACIYDPPNEGGITGSRVQLDVVGQEAGSDRFLMSATDNSGCSNSAVPDSVSGLSRADSFVMHIYASIIPIPTTTPPAVATTTVVPTPMISEILTSTVATLIAVETSSVASIIISTSSVEIAAPVSSTVSPITSSSMLGTSTIVIATSSTGTPIPSVTRVSTVALTSGNLALPTTVLSSPISTITTLTTSVTDGSTTSTPDVVTSFTIPTTTQTNTPTTDSISTLAVTMGTPTSTGVAVTTPTPASVEAIMSTSTSTAQLLASSLQKASSSVTIQSSMVLIATSSVQANGESPEKTSSLEIQTTATFPPPQSTEESTMATTASSTTASSGGMTVIIIAIVVVIVIIVAAVAIVIFFVWVRKRRKRKQMLQLTPGFVNVMYTTRKSTAGASNEAVVINDIYEDTNTTDDKFKEDLESTYTYASGTYDVAMGTYDVPTAVTSTSPLFDSSASYAECGPNDKIRAQSTPYGDATVKFSDLLGEDDRREIYDQLSPYQAPASKEKEIYGQLKSWGTRSIPRSDIQIVGHLGSGQYGSVDQGIWKAPKAEPVDVALKSLTKACEEDRVKFLQEAAIMAQFRHPNVIELYGVVVRGTPTLIVGELATRGDLRTFLHKLRKNARDPNLAQLLLKCSYQVALGMEYLSAKGFVHRDLAARNVLVTEDHICKIADFGMSRDLADENYYVSQGTDKIPVKWTAPEALHYKKYSTASDVWSYGCLLYEIWSIGHKPLEGITNQEAIRLIDSGKRLSPPPGCPKMIYELMILCWHPQTMVRPTFQRNVLTFVGNGDTILEVPKKDSSTNPLAGVLGAPLEAGENMYSQLQRRYRNYDHRAVVETDDDYFNSTSF